LPGFLVSQKEIGAFFRLSSQSVYYFGHPIRPPPSIIDIVGTNAAPKFDHVWGKNPRLDGAGFTRTLKLGFAVKQLPVGILATAPHHVLFGLGKRVL
jgi:hypothetical protein